MRKIFFILILFTHLANAQDVSTSSGTTDYIVASDTSTACVTKSDLKEFSNFFLFIFVISMTAFAFKMGSK